MIIHPDFNPIAISLGPVKIHWYAISYLIGFALFFYVGCRRIKNGYTVITKEQLDDLFTYGVLGVVLGGRLGYVLFYQPKYFWDNPSEIIKAWHGGMSFHGGLIGVMIAMVLFARHKGLKFAQVSDFVAPLVPLGLGSGRIGNFINGELWGRVTNPNAFWAMGFQNAQRDDILLVPHLSEPFQQAYLQYGMLPRHPSPLYEFALEGVALFIILWFFSKKPRPMGQVSALFLIGYGIFRFIIEFARQPDDFLGLLKFNLSMGQWLSIPMILIGIIWFIYAGKKYRLPESQL